MRSTSTRNLVILAIVIPIVAILAIVGLVTSQNAVSQSVSEGMLLEAGGTDQPEALWPTTAEVVSDLHVESLLATQATLAEGSASAETLGEQRLVTDQSMATWQAAGGPDAGRLFVLLEAARDAADLSQAHELLDTADAIVASATLVEPSPVADLLSAARVDAEVAVSGASQANATSSSKAKRTRVAGMIDVADLLLGSNPATDTTNLGTVLGATSEVRTSLVEGEAVTLGEWIDAHVSRQQALGEVASTPAITNAPEGAELADSVSLTPLFVVAGLAAALTAAIGWLLIGRLGQRSESELIAAMQRFGNEQIPSTLSSAPTHELCEQIELLDVDGDRSEAAEAFNSLQRNAAYVIDRQRADQQGAFERLFRSMSERTTETLKIERVALADLAQEINGHDDPGSQLRVRELSNALDRRQRDVHMYRALAGKEAEARFVQDQSMATIVASAAGGSPAPGRVRVISIDSALVDSRCVVDLEHIVSELIENALEHSAPESMVEVVANLTAEGSMLVSVADQGVGMPDEQMDGLNQVLASAPTVTVSTAGSLGVVAMATIAERTGLQVRYTASPEGGTTGLVTVPMAAITELDEPATTGSDDHLMPTAATFGDDLAPNHASPVLGQTDSAAEFNRDLPVAEFEYEPQVDEELEIDGAALMAMMAMTDDEEAAADAVVSGVDGGDVGGDAAISALFDLVNTDDDPTEDSDTYQADGFDHIDDGLGDSSDFGFASLESSPFDDQPVVEAAVTNPLNSPDEPAAPASAPAFDFSADPFADSGETDTAVDNTPAPQAPMRPSGLGKRSIADPKCEPKKSMAKPIARSVAKPERPRTKLSAALPSAPTFADRVESESQDVETAGSKFAALDSLLARVPDEVDEKPKAPVRPAQFAQRIPSGGSTVKPGGIRAGRNRAQVEADSPKSPEDVRTMLSRYRSGQAGVPVAKPAADDGPDLGYVDDDQ